MPEHALVRGLCGVLFLLDLLSYLPWLRVCLGEGYWTPSRWTRGWGLAAVAAAWAAACVSLITGVAALLGALVLLVLFRRVYVNARWTSLFRGGGAPGLMSHYAARLLLLSELAAHLDPGGSLGEHLTTVFAVDFGAILLCSGIYKTVAGYVQGEGMEYGLANPMWGYLFGAYRRLRPGSPLLRAQDAFAATCQVATGICLIVPPWRPGGAFLCMASFLLLVPAVRLGRLAVLMAVLPIPLLGDLAPDWPLFPESTRLWNAAAPAGVVTAAHWLLSAYLVLLPLTKAVQYLNLYGNRQAPEPLQRWIQRYANWVPIIVWRVFTPDVTNFFVRITATGPRGEDPETVLDERTYAYRDWRHPWRTLRFLHVTESIALTTVFTTLKYFRSDRALFEQKLLRYARSLGLAPDRVVRFEYVTIRKTPREFAYVPAVAFRVRLAEGTVEEEPVLADFDPGAPAAHSPIRETTGYGSYVAKRA